MAYTRNTPAWHDYPATDTAIDSVDLEGWEKGLLSTNDDQVALFWNGSTYLPRSGNVAAVGDTSKARKFIGPVDPATVSGISLAVGDEWSVTQ